MISQFFKKNLLITAICLVNLSSLLAKDYINEDKERWKVFYKDLTPTKIVSEWKIPFKTSNRKSIKTMSLISSFGSARNSFRAGHYHTGLDCINKSDSEPLEVYSIADGIVVSIHLADPHQTVVIKHLLKDGKIIFSSYKHINDIVVKVGETVTADTKIARVLTKKESKVFKGNYDHLHLEIRKSFDDYGCASWLTMTKEELQKRFYDPMIFLKEKLNSE